MELNNTPPPPDIQYILDGAGEAWEINAFDHAVLTFYGNRERLDEIINATRGGGFVRGRKEMCRRLDSYAHELATGLTPAEQRTFVASSLVGEAHCLRQLADCYSGWFFEDATVGGCMEPWKKKAVYRPDGSIPARLARRLYAPAAGRRYIKTLGDDLLKQRQALAASLGGLTWPDHPDEAGELQRYYDELRDRHERTIQRGYDQLREQLDTVCTPDEAARLAGVKRRRRLVERRKLKVVKRSVAAAASVLGAESISRFTKGEAITIPGQAVAFSVQKWGRLVTTGHGSLSVAVHALSGEKLSGLCLYFDMPSLDQLAAIALHVEAGNEDHLLETGNLYNITAEGAAHPALMGRRLPAGIPARVARGRDIEMLQGYARTVANRRAYEVKMRPVYFDAVINAVWGSRASRVRRFFAKIPQACTPDEIGQMQ